MDTNKEMGNNAIDPYEHQLLEMFKSCDTQESGYLDCTGLEKLCIKLHLDEAKDQLIECLLLRKATVTFPEFRDALLTLLDSGLRQNEDSREPSPEREVSPKFVFGQKKYGRRSRPESTDQDNGGQDDRLEESDFDTFLPTKEDVTGNLVQNNQQKLQRDADLIFINKDEMELQSRGQPQVDVELRAAWERLGVGSDGYLDQDELALVCRAVGMERAADEIVNEVFSKLDCDRDGRISFNEFLQLFRSGGPTMPSSPQHNSAIPSSSSPTQFHPHHLTSLDINSSGYVSADSIVELWEQSGVPGAANLLQELGFSGTHEVSFSLLNSILDEELRNLKADIAKLPVSPLVTYLSAALSLSHVQIKQLRNSLEQMTGERDKLRNDLAEANHRATLLAQEVDDRHARMERSTQVQVKLLEQRHAEQVKQLGLQLVSEREQLTSTTLRLEKKLADVQEDEVKLRTELAALQSECANMEKENRNLIEQLADYELAQKQAEEQQQKMEALQLRLSDLESNSEQVASFVEQLTELKEENTKLRDRNDELTIQIESLSTRLSNRKQGSCTSLEGGGGGGTKRRGHSPPGVILDSGSWGSMSPSPRQGKVRRCCTENDLSLDNVRMEGLAICQPLRHSESGLGAELDTLDDSLTLSNYSDTTISFKVGSDASKDADVEKLQAHIIELERMVEQYRLKLAVYELGHEAFDEESEEMINSETETPLLNKRPILEDVETSSTKALSDKETNCEMSEFTQKESSVVEMEIQTSIEDPRKVDKLERHCQELQSKLSEVQTKILEMISEKKSCNEENCNLKEKIKILTSNFRGKSPVNFNDGILWESSHNVQLFNEKDNEFKRKNISTLSCNSNNMEINEAVKSEDSDKVTNNLNNQSVCKSPNKFSGFKQTDFNNTKDGSTNENNHKFNFNSLSQFAFEITNNLNDSDLNQRNVTVLESKPLSPLCLKSEDRKSDVNGAISNNFNTTDDETLNNNCESVEEQLSTLISENKVLRDKCNDLESCLEMMRIEYEKCEDYWQNKLDDERRIFDQEQKLSDSKFIELEHKIREYAEMFSTDCEKACDGRLPTIEEKDSLERQFIDLEEEFEEFRKKSEVDGLAREREIMELKEAMANSQIHFPGCDVAVQTANLEIEADSEKQADMKYQWQPENKQIQIENTAEGQVSQCCCGCHQELTEELRKVQQLRSRVQSECKLLTRKRDLLLRNISNLQPRYLPTACEREIMQNLATRLHHQELRCRHLQSALKYQQRQMEKAVQVTWEQHQNDLVNLRGTLNMTQEKLQQQMRLTKELMERLTKADILVKDLYVENGQLVAACHSLEQRYSGEKNTVANLA